MDDLISREAAIKAVKELLFEPDSVQHIYSSDAISAIEKQPAIEAVPLDPLCEKLAEYYHAPCNYRDDICETDENGDCPGIGKPDAECWKHIIRQWMWVRHGNE